MISSALLESPLTDRVFLITSRRPIPSCSRVDGVCDCEKELLDCLRDVTGRADSQEAEVDTGTNSELAKQEQLRKPLIVRNLCQHAR